MTIIALHRDYESRSRADLKKVGAHRYAQDASTELLCAVWIAEHDDGREEVFTWTLDDPYLLPPLPVMEAIIAGKRVGGHNAAFEAAIDEYVCGPRLGWPIPKPEQLDCTMARCAVQALPLDLGRACKVLSLPFQKDAEGSRLMLRMCKPLKKTGEFPYSTQMLHRLLQYCVADVRAEIGLDKALRPLQDQERAVWALDQTINNRGVRVDLDFVRIASGLVERATARLDARMSQITGGAVEKCSEVQKIKQFAKAQGVEFPVAIKTRRGTDEEYESEMADREALQELLAGSLPTQVREAFETRLEAGKASVKKLNKFAAYAHGSPGERARGNLQYHAASPGRWGGRGIQLQNLVRAGISRDYGGWEQAFADMCELDDTTFELVWGSPLDTVSRMLRGAIVAAPGHRLIFGDYSSVEARGCVWAAGQSDMVEIFACDGDTYKEMASHIFRKAAEDIVKGERFVGKTTVLGCGYGMGWRKFKASCKKLGNPVDDELAERAVSTWRERNWRVVELWRAIEGAARAAIEAPGHIIAVEDFISFRVKGRWLQMKLPSGRILWYNRPHMAPSAKDLAELEEGETVPYKRWKIHFWGVNSYTKQWAVESTWGGKLLENAIQGMCRDFLATAILALEANGYPVVLTVHDEAITEPAIGFGSVAEFQHIMSTVPPWAMGFPLKAECGEAFRYAKA